MKNRFAVALAGALMLATLLPASAASHINERDHIRHVLLISVDGLHALDVANFVQSHPNSALAELSGHGITYSNARTPDGLRDCAKAQTKSFEGTAGHGYVAGREVAAHIRRAAGNLPPQRLYPGRKIVALSRRREGTRSPGRSAPRATCWVMLSAICR